MFLSPLTAVSGGVRRRKLSVSMSLNQGSEMSVDSCDRKVFDDNMSTRSGGGKHNLNPSILAHGVSRLDFMFMEFVSKIVSQTWGKSKEVEAIGQLQDYVCVLKEREQRRILFKACDGSTDCHRSTAIRLMRSITEKEKLSRATFYLATYIYDRLKFAVKTLPLNLVVLVSMFIAAKTEERTSTMPKLEVLAKYLQPQGPGELEWIKRVVLRMEPQILAYFNWSFLTPTVYTFLELFCLFVIDPGEIPQIRHSKSPRRRLELPDPRFTDRNYRIVQRYIIEVADVLLEEEPDEKFPPSQVAAALVLFSRIMYGFSGWTNRLKVVTGYDILDCTNCCDGYIYGSLKKVDLSRKDLKPV